MRLPGTSDPADLDVAVVGVPLDTGTSNRPGARFGPRGIRAESVLIRPYNMATRAAPFDSLRIDDTGDVAASPYDLEAAVDAIETHYDSLLAHDLVTASIGGDHTVVLPILRSMAKKHGPVGLVHVDATQLHDVSFGIQGNERFILVQNIDGTGLRGRNVSRSILRKQRSLYYTHYFYSNSRIF